MNAPQSLYGLAVKAFKTAMRALLTANASAATASQNLSVPNNTLDTFTPATLPAGTIIAAAQLTPKGSGRYLIAVTISGTLAAADTLELVGETIAGSTSVSGGTVVNGWNIHQGGAVSQTGGAAAVIVGVTAQSAPAGDLNPSLTLTFPATLPLGEASAIAILLAEATGGHAFSTSQLQLTCYEQPAA